jgi:hypothetical protein
MDVRRFQVVTGSGREILLKIFHFLFSLNHLVCKSPVLTVNLDIKLSESRVINFCRQYTSTFFFRLCAACQCLKHFMCSQHLSLFKIFKITILVCFGLNWPSSCVNNCFLRRLLLFYSVMLRVTSRQENNEEQAH